jgi:hypothetical protein
MRHTMTTDSRRARALALILGLGLIVLLVPPAAALEEDVAPPAGSG